MVITERISRFCSGPNGQRIVRQTAPNSRWPDYSDLQVSVHQNDIGLMADVIDLTGLWDDEIPCTDDGF